MMLNVQSEFPKIIKLKLFLKERGKSILSLWFKLNTLLIFHKALNDAY